MAGIMTTKGTMDEALLEKKPVTIERPTGNENATEYWYQGELVKRDVHFQALSPAELRQRALNKEKA